MSIWRPFVSTCVAATAILAGAVVDASPASADGAAPQGEYTLDIQAGPIWSNEDARQKAPAICASQGGTWNGQWRTVVEGKMSVVGCVFRT